MAERAHDPVRSGAELVSVRTGEWLLSEEIKRPLVVFVHGFTAHGRYLERPAKFVLGSGYTAAYFNYDSYVGIERAASALAARLDTHGRPLSQHGIVFVGHSMGGLVVRSCTARALGPLAAFVRGTVLLGTPNEGTLNNGWMLARILDVGDRLTRFNPYFRLPTCRAAQQLTLSDSEDFLLNLNADQRKTPPSFPTLSISGGLNQIELGEGLRLLVNRLCNKIIQKALAEVPNDGLVLERSSDLGRVLNEPTKHRHFTRYDDYSTTNHSALAGNQEVTDLILGFLKRFAP